ncbi:dTDP-4-dehydrorhamnose 3,5-epimerase family protein [Streptacidiphilus neutrinimicus]|uniref:dTDP-4-dehydrorhamnose 3,5-epimerase family protein n=1 Tax=Streptacidiphilus neutrinimicus TaxID=105420 RepID=UPI003F6F432F
MAVGWVQLALTLVTDDATLSYLCSEMYNPSGEHGIHPLDPALGIAWPAKRPQLSAKDEAAPTLAEAEAACLLPRYEECRRFTESLRG